MRWSLLMAAAMLSVSAPALAGPWIDPGDVQVREAVERLNAARLIHGPTNAWPLPWPVMSDLARAADDDQLPPYMTPAAQRLHPTPDTADTPHCPHTPRTQTTSP